MKKIISLLIIIYTATCMQSAQASTRFTSIPMDEFRFLRTAIQVETFDWEIFKFLPDEVKFQLPQLGYSESAFQAYYSQMMSQPRMTPKRMRPSTVTLINNKLDKTIFPQEIFPDFYNVEEVSYGDGFFFQAQCFFAAAAIIAVLNRDQNSVSRKLTAQGFEFLKKAILGPNETACVISAHIYLHYYSTKVAFFYSDSSLPMLEQLINFYEINVPRMLETAVGKGLSSQHYPRNIVQSTVVLGVMYVEYLLFGTFFVDNAGVSFHNRDEIKPLKDEEKNINVKKAHHWMQQIWRMFFFGDDGGYFYHGWRQKIIHLNSQVQLNFNRLSRQPQSRQPVPARQPESPPSQIWQQLGKNQSTPKVASSKAQAGAGSATPTLLSNLMSDKITARPSVELPATSPGSPSFDEVISPPTSSATISTKFSHKNLAALVESSSTIEDIKHSLSYVLRDTQNAKDLLQKFLDQLKTDAKFVISADLIQKSSEKFGVQFVYWYLENWAEQTTNVEFRNHWKVAQNLDSVEKGSSQRQLSQKIKQPTRPSISGSGSIDPTSPIIPQHILDNLSPENANTLDRILKGKARELDDKGAEVAALVMQFNNLLGYERYRFTSVPAKLRKGVEWTFTDILLKENVINVALDSAPYSGMHFKTFPRLRAIFELAIKK